MGFIICGRVCAFGVTPELHFATDFATALFLLLLDRRTAVLRHPAWRDTLIFPLAQRLPKHIAHFACIYGENDLPASTSCRNRAHFLFVDIKFVRLFAPRVENGLGELEGRKSLINSAFIPVLNSLSSH